MRNLEFVSMRHDSGYHFGWLQKRVGPAHGNHGDIFWNISVKPTQCSSLNAKKKKSVLKYAENECCTCPELFKAATFFLRLCLSSAAASREEIHLEVQTGALKSVFCPKALIKRHMPAMVAFIYNMLNFYWFPL